MYQDDYDKNEINDNNDYMYSDELDSIKIKKSTSIFKAKQNRSNFVLGVIISTFRILIIVLFCLSLAILGTVVGIAKAYVETAPTLDLAKLDDQAKTSFIYDYNGDLITDYKGIENRVMVSIDSMSQNLKYAFVAVEDARFYSHNGIDIKRIFGAFIHNFTSGSQQGGSTITQQLIKNTVLSSEQSYKRKIQEAYLAIQLETQYTKEQILESYLNTIYLGENYYGVQVAAKGYFGKNLDELSLRECAILAGMTTNPYYYNPRRNYFLRESDTTDYKELTNNRTDYVLRTMYESQFITEQQYMSALDQNTANILEKSPTADSQMYAYAHYIEYAVNDIIDVFLEQRNLENTSKNRYAMESELRTGGYHIKLAIDTQIQTIVEDSLEQWSKYPNMSDPSDKVYRSKNADGTYQEIIQPQASAVVLDYRTGELKAIVGSRTKPTQRKTFNRAIDMNMPVGSAIKPIAVYAPAIELGASPASIVYNMPIPISGWLDENKQNSWPQNYGGSSYTGPETLRTALKKSHNTSAASALMLYVGVDRAVDYLLKEGVDIKNINATPFGVALGSSGITPLQMSVAYGVLGNGGIYQEPISFLGISDSAGNVIYDSHKEQERRQVFKASTAWLTIDMMKDVVESGTGTNAQIKGQTVAGKTGTNSEQRGVFFCGMTGWYSASLWIGHDNYKSLYSKATGGKSAAPLWTDFMTKIHQAKQLPDKNIIEGTAEDFGLIKVRTCVVSGQLATDACQNDYLNYGTVTDYWTEQNVPKTSCQMHKSVNICTVSNALATQYCPAETIVTKGVVVIPNGHPLSSLIDTKYASVLQKYLGNTATIHFNGDTNQLNAMQNMMSCPIHTQQNSGDTVVSNTLIPDAQRLITAAQSIMNNYDSNSQNYINLSNAINNLQNVINNNGQSYTDVAQAMSILTQAMATE